MNHAQMGKNQSCTNNKVGAKSYIITQSEITKNEKKKKIKSKENQPWKEKKTKKKVKKTSLFFVCANHFF